MKTLTKQNHVIRFGRKIVVPMVSDAIFLIHTLEVKKLLNKILLFCQGIIKSLLLPKLRKANCFLLGNEFTYFDIFVHTFFLICSS